MAHGRRFCVNPIERLFALSSTSRARPLPRSCRCFEVCIPRRKPERPPAPAAASSPSSGETRDALPKVGPALRAHRSKARAGFDVEVSQLPVQDRQADRPAVSMRRRRDGRARRTGPAPPAGAPGPAADAGGGPRPDRHEHERLDRDEIERPTDSSTGRPALPISRSQAPTARSDGGWKDAANDLACRTGIGHLASQCVLGSTAIRADC